MDNIGTLFMVATPIGNLGDMTQRAIETLRAADVVAAEDTRHTLQLLTHFGIKNKLVRYDEHSKEHQGEIILSALREGKNVALVSDAGFPGISDPGEDLVRLAVNCGIKVVPVPGANAALTALVASGLPITPFFFGGFLPKSKRNRAEKLREWKNIPATILLYEAPHRIKEVLEEILAEWGDRRIAIGRELTKLHEEFWRGTVSGSLLWLGEKPPRGEFVLVIEKSPSYEVKPSAELSGSPLDEVKKLLERGGEKKQILQTVAKRYKIPKRDLYNALLRERDAEANAAADENN